MSEVLAEKPSLRQALAAFHPVFARLSHPVLGKILPRLVTVADAAKVAGVDAALLLDLLNLPGPPVDLGTRLQPASAGGSVLSSARPGWLRDPHVLDVRPELAAGGDPLASILGTLRTLPEGKALTVIAPFEPAPLVRLLAGRGFATHVEWADGACHASFWGKPVEVAPAAVVEVEHTAEGAQLDVRALEPPEPMRRVLAALDAGHVPLTVIHTREPALLFPRLVERGLRWEIQPVDDHLEIRITR
jgi:uncharacterized protein (DUF2249 family)